MDVERDLAPVVLLACIAVVAVVLIVGYVWPLADDVTRQYLILTGS